ncbi:MAG: adenylosuccinate lyase [Deltaproteobacteria bacterium]|nr:adenylosuccinate lyase [Deltaproteobacteria bacterium]
MAAYQSPLATRYATAAMVDNFGDVRRVLLWRDLWIALARGEQKLGVPITDAQIDALVEHREEVDLDRVAQLEAELRHDVMAHVRHYGECVGPAAEKIIHLGATSCYVADNAELVMMRDGLELLMDRMFTVIEQLAGFANEHRDLPTLAYTHFQPAQLTTVGKRACLWTQDLVFDLQTVDGLLQRLPFRGVKGTTGTQASFLALLDGDHDKVRSLDQQVCKAFGFSESVAVSGQTYPRKFDTWVVSALSDICGSAAKLASDIRLLAHEREVEEPFGRKQIGSSAMAYKRNPMRSERICSLARFVGSLTSSPRETHANQWLERTLDDSANRRLVLTEAFLATDAVLNLLADITAALVVHPAVVRANLEQELPFMATENVIMAGVRGGCSRQDLHERIRVHSHEAVRRMKEEGASNDLLGRLRNDEVLGPFVDDTVLDPVAYVGRAPQQVQEFLAEVVHPLLEQHQARRGRFTSRVKV